MDDPWLRHRDNTRMGGRFIEARAVGCATDTLHTISDRVIRAITASGFPPLLVEDGEVVLSGFIIEPEADNSVKVRWIGQPDVNSPPYRRTFLSVYAFILLEAGLTIQYVTHDLEAYLICRAP
jgi:hypothetical protein